MKNFKKNLIIDVFQIVKVELNKINVCVCVHVFYLFKKR